MNYIAKISNTLTQYGKIEDIIYNPLVWIAIVAGTASFVYALYELHKIGKSKNYKN